MRLCWAALALGCAGLSGIPAQLEADATPPTKAALRDQSFLHLEDLEHLVEGVNRTLLSFYEQNWELPGKQAPPPQRAALGREGERGVLFIGFGDVDWCGQTATSRASLAKHVGCLKEKECKVAFVGDAPGVAKVRAGCPEAFDVVAEQDLSGCPMPAKTPQNKRTWKTCVRAQEPLFTYTVFLDADAEVVDAGVEKIFTVLSKGFDMTAAMECCARTNLGWHEAPSAKDSDPAVLDGWEMNTGVLGFANTPAVREHAREAMELYNDGYWEGLSSGEQSFETLALSRADVHFFPLPPTFNMRTYTADGYKSMSTVIKHEHKDDNAPWIAEEEKAKETGSYKGKHSAEIPYLMKEGKLDLDDFTSKKGTPKRPKLNKADLEREIKEILSPSN